ncbi:hypothetical protein NDN08_002294 [Rhodosorus marinus]|uniref:Uncharacterized protein n=1 Tax=Rhodosorus marinus TaxID=101924 RepID=A0AAV8UTD6_9RHOD|nr:hypothetical protein NDN08_002294 [Rhodosorus marinus]
MRSIGSQSGFLRTTNLSSGLRSPNSPFIAPGRLDRPRSSELVQISGSSMSWRVVDSTSKVSIPSPASGDLAWFSTH